jgi:hypothetical protein
MRTTRTGERSRIKAGDWIMSIWIGDDLVTYRAGGGTHGWIVVNSVAGAGPHLRDTRPVPNLGSRTRKGKRNEDA